MSESLYDKAVPKDCVYVVLKEMHPCGSHDLRVEWIANKDNLSDPAKLWNFWRQMKFSIMRMQNNPCRQCLLKKSNLILPSKELDMTDEEIAEARKKLDLPGGADIIQ